MNYRKDKIKIDRVITVKQVCMVTLNVFKPCVYIFRSSLSTRKNETSGRGELTESEKRAVVMRNLQYLRLRIYFITCDFLLV